MISLMGSHRVGKTTLARAYAEKHKIPFVQTSASGVFKDMGLDPAVTYPFGTRLVVQNEILARFGSAYAEHTEIAITDRTPLDLLAYTMADAIGNSVSPNDQKAFKKYVQDCIDMTNRRCSVLMVVQPGIPLVHEEGKAALNEAYIEHLNSICLGLSIDERLDMPSYYIPRNVLDLNERIGALEYAYGAVKKRALQERGHAVIH